MENNYEKITLPHTRTIHRDTYWTYPRSLETACRICGRPRLPCHLDWQRRHLGTYRIYAIKYRTSFACHYSWRSIWSCRRRTLWSMGRNSDVWYRNDSRRYDYFLFSKKIWHEIHWAFRRQKRNRICKIFTFQSKIHRTSFPVLPLTRNPKGFDVLCRWSYRY